MMTLCRARGPRQEVEALEDEAQLGRPHQGPLVGRELAHLLAVEPEFAGTGPVEAAEDVHQRRLAGAGGPHQRHHFAAAMVSEMPLSTGTSTSPR